MNGENVEFLFWGMELVVNWWYIGLCDLIFFLDWLLGIHYLKLLKRKVKKSLSDDIDILLGLYQIINNCLKNTFPPFDWLSYPVFFNLVHIILIWLWKTVYFATRGKQCYLMNPWLILFLIFITYNFSLQMVVDTISFSMTIKYGRVEIERTQWELRMVVRIEVIYFLFVFNLKLWRKNIVFY